MTTSANEALDTEPRPFSVILLAGALRPSSLRQQLDIPVLALPLAGGETMVDQWLSSIAATPGCRSISIVLSSDLDARRLKQVIREARRAARWSQLPDVDVLVDPKDWRGPAGLVRDIAFRQGNRRDDVVLIGEAACLPPASFQPLLEAFASGAGGVVAGTDAAEPAGVYAFESGSLERIPTIGFCDLKEQFIPDLHEAGVPVRLVRTVDEVVRVRSREEYLRAVQRTLARGGVGRCCDSRASISDTAFVSGASLVRQDVVIEDGAVAHESVLLAGSRLRAGAVVSQCVIGPRVEIGAGRVCRREVLASPLAGVAANGNGRAAHGSRRRFRIATLLPDAIAGGKRP